jgi:hypothetical protein
MVLGRVVAFPVDEAGRLALRRHPQPWELYHIETDFSQATDLATEHPGKLRELQEQFLAEAAKYNVLPLDDRFAQRVDPALRPSLIAGKTSFVFWPGTIRVPEPCASPPAPESPWPCNETSTGRQTATRPAR